ncbi:hypothetical protein LguiA_020782 [Lonicera macranthoides]
MKVKVSLPFKCKKLLNPCKKLLQLFRFKFKKPLSIKYLRFHKQDKKPKNDPKRKHFTGLTKAFRWPRNRSREMDRVMELKSFSENQNAPCPSPLTPAYVRMHGDSKTSVGDEVEDACRSFENYLVEMIVEEGKTKDLADVEELLYCWNNLKCPVFTGLVCRFYGELCTDLFSNNSGDDLDSPN